MGLATTIKAAKKLVESQEPVVWDARGPIRLVAALALHEIRRAGSRPLALPACRDPRLHRVAAALFANPADPRDLVAHADAAGASVRTLTRLFRAVGLPSPPRTGLETSSIWALRPSTAVVPNS